MEVASSTKENSHTTKISSPKESVVEQKHESSFENVQSQAMQAMQTPHGNKIKSSSRPARKQNRLSAKSMKKKYALRSSAGSTRVLRSRVQGSSKAPDLINNSANVSSERDKKRKKRKRTKKMLNDEYSRIRKHLKYLLRRTNYEHNLIDAYAGEGWRGQSAEKIKPEKELQRATSEISRCKLKIRDLFKQLDSLCAEGRFQESLFDSEGQISSDDIFCAKCGSKDLSADNDIILCDGTCIRGFHQMCLEPPLMNEEIPPGDEGWLCPGCDCKVDCTDLVNDCLGTDLSIDDSWEKVFPEVAAISAGNKLEDNLGLPSDDSEDNDYDPDGPEVDEKVETDGSSSEESDFTSASDEAEDLPLKEQNLGLPSDDSEDDDYDPTALDADEHVKKESSSSDFTSDSGDSGPLGDANESSGTDEVPVSISADGTAPLVGASHRRSTKARQKKQTINSELLSILEPDPSLGNASPVSGKRHREQLDYKKLHDETYGNGSSDSSDDEDWTDAGGPGKREGADKESVLSPKENFKTGNIEESQKTRTRLTLDFDVADKSTCDTHNDGLEPDSIGKGDTSSASRRLGKAETERLLESFGDNAHPTRDTKEKLAAELGITLRQVSKWFDHRRWKLRVSTKVEASGVETTSPSNKNSSTGTSRKSLLLEPRNRTTNEASNGKRTTNSGKPVIVLGLPSPNSGWDVERRKRMIGEITPQKSGGSAVRSKEAGFSPKGNSRTFSGGDTLQKFKKVGDSQNKRTRLTLDSGGADKSASDTHTDGLEPSTGEGESKSAYKTPGKAGTQRLLESFGDNTYPTREAKGKLAAELGMTLQQVSKWFDHRRWKLRRSEKVEPGGVETASLSKENLPTGTDGNPLEPEPRNLNVNGASNGGRDTNLGKASKVLALESPKRGNEESRGCMNVESTPHKSMAPELINGENGQVDDMALTVAGSNNETPIKCTPTDSTCSQTLRRSGRIKTQAKK